MAEYTLLELHIHDGVQFGRGTADEAHPTEPTEDEGGSSIWPLALLALALLAAVAVAYRYLREELPEELQAIDERVD